MSIASVGELTRMTQYKSTPADRKTAHLLTYPVLMTHDVVGYHNVLVGEDQRQHLEYARRLLRKFNRAFQQDVPIPKTNVMVGRIRDLRRPKHKMSKSSPDGCLFLDDGPDEIRRKIKRATMDIPGRANLSFLYQHFVGGEVPESNRNLKDSLCEALIAAMRV